MAYASWSVVFGEQPSAAKWNILGTNDAYFDSLIGSGTAWATFAPALANVSGGTLTYAKYQQFGKTVHFRIKYTFAGAGVAGSVSFTPPVTLNSGYAATDSIGGIVSCYDSSATTSYAGVMKVLSTTSIEARAIHTDGTRANYEVLSSINPFTWATTDTLVIVGTYEAA